MSKNKVPMIPISPGDIVTFNPNDKLRTYGIVCDVRDDGLAYIVPMIKAICKEPDNIYLPFNAENDFRHFNSSIKEGTIQLAVGRMYFRTSISSVVGRCTSVFFGKVVKGIPNAVNFTGDKIEYVRVYEDMEETIAMPSEPVFDSPYIPLKMDEKGAVVAVGY